MNPDDLRELGVVRVATPCNRRFEDLEGDGSKRYCRDCKLHVYDFAQLTASEARALLVETDGRLCGRIFTRADGTVMTRDCPVGVARVKGWVFARLAAVSAALAALLTGGVAWRTATVSMGGIAAVPQRNGILEVGPTPWRKVYVDGALIGGGGIMAPVAAGRHLVVVETEAGLKTVHDVTIVPNQTTTIE